MNILNIDKHHSSVESLNGYNETRQETWLVEWNRTVQEPQKNLNNDVVEN